MYWVFDMKTVDLRNSYSVGREYAMNIIITWVQVLNAPECDVTLPERLVCVFMLPDGNPGSVLILFVLSGNAKNARY